jgi:ARC6-like, IMS domain
MKSTQSKKFLSSVISGGTIGLLLLAGLWFFNLNQKQSLLVKNRPSPPLTILPSSPSPSPIPSSTPFPIASQPSNQSSIPITTTQALPIPSQSPGILNPSNPSPSVSPIANNNTNTISKEAATDVVKRWIEYKRVLLAPPYNTSLGAEILTDKAYIDNIDRSSVPCNKKDRDECLSSVDWLKKNGAEYSFGVQRIDSVDRFEVSGDRASIFVTITEYRTLHQGGKSTPSGGVKKARYDLQHKNGKVKITDYKVF